MKSGGQRKRHHVHAYCDEVCACRQPLFYDRSTVQVRDVQVHRDDVAAMQRCGDVVQEH
jgi:hypothetical protein